MLAGRPHEAAGNGSPRWMAAGPRKRVHRTRPTGRLARRLTWPDSVIVRAWRCHSLCMLDAGKIPYAGPRGGVQIAVAEPATRYPGKGMTSRLVPCRRWLSADFHASDSAQLAGGGCGHV